MINLSPRRLIRLRDGVVNDDIYLADELARRAGQPPRRARSPAARLYVWGAVEAGQAAASPSSAERPGRRVGRDGWPVRAPPRAGR